MLDQKTKNLRYLGIILFTLGSIVAISSGAKMPVDGAKFSDTTMVFIVALILGIVGNILWHKTEKQAVLAELESHKNDEASNPTILLKNFIPKLEEIKTKGKGLQGMELCNELDLIMDKYLHPLVAKRKILIDLLGQEKGAEVLLIIAYAERMLNRVWSASSDGYPDEAQDCLEDSLNNFKQALAKLS